MSVATSVQEIVDDDIDKRLRMSVAIITWLTIIFVPIYSKTITGQSFHETITEESFIWPWMVLTRYTPQGSYNADQIAVVAFPWSFIMFIPFFYALKFTWNLYNSNEDRTMNSVKIVIASIIQYFLIFITYKSQDPSISDDETVTAYFFPQVILIIIHGILSINWFIKDINQSSQPKK